MKAKANRPHEDTHVKLDSDFCIKLERVHSSRQKKKRTTILVGSKKAKEVPLQKYVGKKGRDEPYNTHSFIDDGAIDSIPIE